MLAGIAVVVVLFASGDGGRGSYLLVCWEKERFGVEAEETRRWEGVVVTAWCWVEEEEAVEMVRLLAGPLATWLARTPKARVCMVSRWQYCPGEAVTTSSIFAEPPVVNVKAMEVARGRERRERGSSVSCTNRRKCIPKASCSMWVSLEFL